MVPRLEAVTQNHVILPFLVAGTRLVSFVPERLLRSVSAHVQVRRVRFPIELRPLVEAMYWTTRSSDDPAHRWLRARLVEQAERIYTSLSRAGAVPPPTAARSAAATSCSRAGSGPVPVPKG